MNMTLVEWSSNAHAIGSHRRTSFTSPGLDDSSPGSAVLPAHIPNSVLAWTRIDPFDTFCVESSQEDQNIFDHSICSQWSRFAPSQESADLALVKKHVMGYIVNHPVSYYSLLFAGACHRNFWEKSRVRSSEHDTELLWLKMRAIRAMRKAIEQTNGYPPDDVLIALLMLAVFDKGDTVKRRIYGIVQTRKALTYTLDAEFYCALDVEWRHLNVFYNLVERRGGILTMQPSALRTSAILFDVFNAYIHLTTPKMAALAPLDATLATMRTWTSDEVFLETASRLGKGFDEVFDLMWDCPESKSLREVVDGSTLIMLDFDHIERAKRQLCSRIGAPSDSSVMWCRSRLLQELLILPQSLESTCMEAELPILIYEMCRLAILMFYQVWLLADNNNNRRMARRQICLLLPLLAIATTLDFRVCETLPDFYVWIVVLGLMLAYEDFDISGDETCVRAIAPFAIHSMVKTRPNAWIIVRNVLPSFIWLWQDCDATGKEAWERACRVLGPS